VTDIDEPEVAKSQSIEMGPSEDLITSRFRRSRHGFRGRGRGRGRGRYHISLLKQIGNGMDHIAAGSQDAIHGIEGIALDVGGMRLL
jgi:hypothetical protein